MTNKKRFLPLSWKGFAFEPFQVLKQGAPLASFNLHPDLELIAFTRGGSTRVLIAREMAYHHVAQGELEGIPYVISF
jgi:hypothetical protein